MQRISGGIPVGGNLSQVAGGNPLLDPRFKIQGGESWHRRPLLPGQDTWKEEQKQFTFPVQPQLPAAGIGNVGGMLVAQAQPTPYAAGPKRTLKELIGYREGSMSDIPGDVSIRHDTQFMPYEPGNAAMNSRSNPLRNYRWPYGMQWGMGPGITPYFGRYQGPGLQGELGTGAI